MLKDVEPDYETYTTTNREDFRIREIGRPPIDQPRREILKQFYRQQAAKQIFEEMRKPPEEKYKIDYTTSYHDHYDIKGFEPKDTLELVNPELAAKYPLYDDPPLTVYLDKIDRIKPKAKAKLPMTAFRKSSIFVKKWYDEIE